MSAPQNVVTDLAAFAERSQTAATDVFESWTSTVATIGDAAGTQASSLRRLVRGMFDLADQAVASSASWRRSSRSTRRCRPRRSTRSAS